MWARVAGHDVVPSGWAGVALVAGGLAGQIAPLVAGMWLRIRDAERAATVHRVARRVADLLLAVLVVYFVVTGAGQLPTAGWASLGVAAVLVALCLSLTWLARLGSPAVCRAVAMTSAVRNLSLALFIATPSGDAVVLALLVYGLVMYALSVPVALRLGRTAVS